MIKRKKKKVDRKEIEKQNKLFLEIWKERPHKCQSCNVYLGREPRTYMFDHLLEKSKYPKFRHDKKNIYLCCLNCHDLKTRGFPTENHQKAIKTIKTNYNI